VPNPTSSSSQTYVQSGSVEEEEGKNVESEAQQTVDPLVASITTQLGTLPKDLEDVLAIYRHAGFLPTEPPITPEEVERQFIQLVEEKKFHQQCDHRMFGESLQHIIMRNYRDLFPTAVQRAINANTSDESLRKASEHRAHLLGRLTVETWYQLVNAILVMNGHPILKQHGFGSVILFDKGKSYQELPESFCAPMQRKILDRAFDDPLLMEKYMASCRNKCFTANGQRVTVRATDKTVIALIASEYATHTDGTAIVRTSTTTPLPGQVVKGPDVNVPLDCIKESIVMHVGFTQMCLNDSENAKAHAVHLGTDDKLVEAYKLLCNGASLNVMKEPVTAFIAGRHGHYNPTAGPQGKHSSLTIVRPVNPTAQLANNLVRSDRQTDIVADHISDQSCIRCGGYILKSDSQSSSNLPSSTPATHSDISHCLFHLSIVDAH
jgi:hypothetical protein